ncbi:hypothetical protein [Pseudomonas fluorescens]|uniref:hypothetical protein n=1 Tax=Pseudomonas fluorescens TaxID=294 RepID=UPI001242D420|nr:hypothetical protein [Pseudomonas fluorescens]
MSTLNEIAANHARMAKALAEESTELNERHTQIVGSLEAPATHAKQHVPLHLLAGVKDNHPGQVAGYLI